MDRGFHPPGPMATAILLAARPRTLRIDIATGTARLAGIRWRRRVSNHIHCICDYMNRGMLASLSSTGAGT